MLINIEGTDASGKETQSKMLYNYFKGEKIPTKLVSFPDYKSESSALVKMYLRGDFGSKAEDVGPKAASIFYASDRFASYKTNWEKDYKNGCTIVSDRYTSSNIIHQASKLESLEEKIEFIDWLYNLEYEIFNIPKPDLVVFLNMPPEISYNLMKRRLNKFSGEESKDIHEKDYQHLKKAYDNAIQISSLLKWTVIDCLDSEGKLKSKKDIHQEIISAVESKRFL